MLIVASLASQQQIELKTDLDLQAALKSLIFLSGSGLGLELDELRIFDSDQLKLRQHSNDTIIAMN